MYPQYNINFEYEEIYPFIFVYKNLYPDHDVLRLAIEQSIENNKEHTAISKWVPWFVFGIYCDILGVNSLSDQIENLILGLSNGEKGYEAVDSALGILKKELTITSRISHAVNSAISHYIGVNKINVPENSYITTANIGRYDPNVDLSEFSDDRERKYVSTMNFHTDYQMGEWYWPGEKFLLTATSYLNDDYSGGEIIFSIKQKEIIYKPKAGDLLVFPSGSPLFPGGEPYFHAVGLIKDNYKFLVRNYLKHSVEKGEQKWYDGISKYGEIEWLEIAKKRLNAHNQLEVLQDGRYIYSGLVKKLFNMPLDEQSINKTLYYDDDEVCW
jgi:hypothetical protein